MQTCLLEDTEYERKCNSIRHSWKLPFEAFHKIDDEHPDVGHYLEKWHNVEYANARKLSTARLPLSLLEVINYIFTFHLMMLTVVDKNTVIQFLYAVRKPFFCNNKSRCDLMFPHRYCEKNGLTSKEDIIDAVIACLKGELPKIVATYVYEDIDSEDYDLLNKVVYLDVQEIFERRSSNFVKRVIQRPTHLVVVVLEPLRYLDDENHPASLDKFITFLSTQITFSYSRYSQIPLGTLYHKRI